MAESEQGTMQNKHVLIGCTGSVASIKIPQLVETLTKSEYQFEVQVVATDHSTHFFDVESLPVTVHRDLHEWQMWQRKSDPVLHIELRRWADLMVVAPLDANTMAKMAGGLCDNLLTCVVRAWDPKKPLLFAPAMNTYMWDHPVTAEHVQKLLSFGYIQIPCIEKTLMCGDTGMGAMAEVPAIVEKVEHALVNTDKGKEKD